MTNKILVTYATLTDSTAEVAQTIGQRLRDAGANVDVHPVQRVAYLSSYGAAIVGSGVRWGKPYAEVTSFLKKHEQALSSTRVAYFIVCGAMHEDTEENRQRASNYMNKLREAAPQVRPVATELFGGRVDYQKLSPGLRLVLKLMRKPQGDFRNWDVIYAWAMGLENVLLGAAAKRDGIESVHAAATQRPEPEPVRQYSQVPG